MNNNIKILDVVAILEDIPEKNLFIGQVGTIVEKLADGVFEVEFCDSEGRTYATAAVEVDKMIVLKYESVMV